MALRPIFVIPAKAGIYGAASCGNCAARDEAIPERKGGSRLAPG
jgi:hypothetical protein